MSSPQKLEVGDTVHVFDINGRRTGQPENGWIGRVTKVGRSLVTVEYDRCHDGFKLETLVINNKYGNR